MKGRGAMLVSAGAGLTVLPPLLGFDPYDLHVLATAFLLAALASSWNLLAYAGQISFGLTAFFGLGAYAAALMAPSRGAPWLALAAAGVAGATGGLVMGAASVRLRGVALALGTLGFAEVCRGLALNWESLTGGGAGLIGLPPLPALPQERVAGRAAAYYLALALLAAAVGSFVWMRRSRAGLAWAAVREDEERAALLGLNTAAAKLAAFALSGMIAGLAGGLYAFMVRVVAPDLVFALHFSILPLVMATFGGLRTAAGPALAAIALSLMSELWLHPLSPTLNQVGYAAALIAAVLYLPAGLAGLLPKRKSRAGA